MGSYKADRSFDRDPSNDPNSSGGNCVYNWSTAWSLLLPRSRTDIRRVASANRLPELHHRQDFTDQNCRYRLVFQHLRLRFGPRNVSSKKSERPRKWKSEKMSFLMKPRAIQPLLLHRLQRLNNDGVVENALQSGPDDRRRRLIWEVWSTSPLLRHLQ